jgi:deazaflavin-dependent oxidoreductase (nitroreductase family)
VTNPLFGPAAGRLPYFALIHHRGRVSGQLYRTPVNAFSTDGGFIVALTYGRTTDWVHNVMASSGCEIRYGGRRLRLTAPRLVGRAEASAAIPSFVLFFLDLLRVEDFLSLNLAITSAPAGQS